MSETIEKGTQITHEGASYTIGDELGSGLFGVVYLAQCADGTSVAIKKTKKTLVDPLTNDQFQNEIFCLKFISHPAIPKWIANFQSESGYGYLVMEYVEGQDLNEYAESHSITEQEALKITKSVADALQKLADRNPSILHYDIRPNNIRVSPIGSPYLLDFGSVGIGDKLQPTTMSIYSPPEQVNHEEVDQRGVIYSLGATLFDILTNQDPPDPVSRVGRANSKDIEDLLLAGNISDDLATFVARMMHPEKPQRYQSFTELRTAMDELTRRRTDMEAMIRRMLETSDVHAGAIADQRIAVPARVRRAPTLPINGESTNPPPRRWIPLAGLGLSSTLVLVGIALIFQSQLWVSPPNNPTNGVLDSTTTPIAMTPQTPSAELPTTTVEATPNTVTPQSLPTVESPTTTATIEVTSNTVTTPTTPIETPSSVATNLISIDQTAFEQFVLFDIPFKITGKAVPETEVQITISTPFVSMLTVSVASQNDGVWTWRPSLSDPALAAGDYTIIANVISRLTGEIVFSVPVTFHVQIPPGVIMHAETRMYTQPDPNTPVVNVLAAVTHMEVVGWTVIADEEWYHVRTTSSRRLGWIQASSAQQRLVDTDKQRLPRQP